MIALTTTLCVIGSNLIHTGIPKLNAPFLDEYLHTCTISVQGLYWKKNSLHTMTWDSTLIKAEIFPCMKHSFADVFTWCSACLSSYVHNFLMTLFGVHSSLYLLEMTRIEFISCPRIIIIMFQWNKFCSNSEGEQWMSLILENAKRICPVDSWKFSISIWFQDNWQPQYQRCS